MRKFLLASFAVFALSIFAYSQDETPKQIDDIGATVNCEDYLARMDGVLVEANNNPSSQIYVLTYEGKTAGRYKSDGSVQWLLPQIGLAKARINSMKKYVKDVRRFDVSRFVFVEAGVRENSTVEFWLVPPGTAPPEPAPTLKTTKYRKGKPAGFCLGCCP